MSHLYEAPLVSVGIPTYNRADYLAKALASLAEQNFRDFEVILSDNCSPDTSTTIVAESFVKKLPRMRIVRQSTNIGVGENFQFVLKEATGKYFMWLADDDVIGDESYLERLVDELEQYPDAVTAFGTWRTISNTGAMLTQAQQTYDDPRWWRRCQKFIRSGTDEFFYGLHRTSAVRASPFMRLWRVSRGSLLDGAYPFLLRLLIQGQARKVSSGDTFWANHNSSPKQYRRDAARYIFFVRRLNIHFEYLSSIVQLKGYSPLIYFAPYSAFRIVVEYSVAVSAFFGIRIKALFLRQRPSLFTEA